MTADADPAASRHALRRRLEQARAELGISYGAVANALGWPLSDLLLVAAVADGIEDGRLRALMDHYGMTEPSEELQAPLPSPLSTAVRVLAAYESQATAVRTFEPFLIPGLLQTRTYARSVLRFYATPQNLEALVDARLARQEIFDGVDGPEMVFLLDESALHRWAGAAGEGSAIMREQLEHIRRMARHPRVRLNIISYAAGVHEGVKGPFVVLESAGPLLYLEDAKGDVISASAEDIGLHQDRFANLAAGATASEDLAAFLDGALARLA
ncbi:MAG: DUF5753 domain-containing protein [Actinomycetota bacterium]|nr:DUF5753 domain-containing protein [Actinomycetota bacterium]